YDVMSTDEPFGQLDGWRTGADPAPTLIALTDQDDRLWSFGFSADEIDDAGALALIDRDSVTIAWHGQTWSLEVPDPMRGGHQRGAATDADLVSPMPGTVLRVDVVEGDSVVEGQALGVVEAMKMELA